MLLLLVLRPAQRPASSRRPGRRTIDAYIQPCAIVLEKPEEVQRATSGKATRDEHRPSGGLIAM